MTEMQEYYSVIKDLKAELIPVKDPRAVQAGDFDADIAMSSYAKNGAVYARLEVKAGARVALLEKDYAEMYLTEMVALTDEELEKIACTRSHKEKIVKAKLREQQFLINETTAARKYFANMFNTMENWVNICKKLRENR